MLIPAFGTREGCQRWPDGMVGFVRGRASKTYAALVHESATGAAGGRVGAGAFARAGCLANTRVRAALAGGEHAGVDVGVEVGGRGGEGGNGEENGGGGLHVVCSFGVEGLALLSWCFSAECCWESKGLKGEGRTGIYTRKGRCYTQISHHGPVQGLESRPGRFQ